MPQNSAPNLTVQFNEAATGQLYDYSALSLLSAFPDSSQLEVLWDVDFVYTASGEGGAKTTVETLADEVQTAIKTLVLDTHFTVDPTTKEITILVDNIEDASVSTAQGTYFYPSTFTVSGSQNLKIRRSTDITNQVVTFQPGSRLTAENLNLSTGQLFNAVQELTAFGSGGASGTLADLDLSNNLVTELSDVNFTADEPAIAYWTGSTLENATDIGNLVPDTAGAKSGEVVTFRSPDIIWDTLTFLDIQESASNTTTLTTRIGNIDTSIQTLEAKTEGMERSAGKLTMATDTVILTDGNLTMTNGDITVTAGDVTIQGESVYDYISNEPYFWQLPSSSMVTITGGGVKLFGNSADFPSHTSPQFSSTDAGSDLVNGIWTAPKAMTISVSATLLVTNGAGNITIQKNEVEVGASHLLSDVNTNITLTRVFNVDAGDEVKIEVDKTSAAGIDLAANRASASLHEVR